MKTALRCLAPVALVATGACFATSNDVKLLQVQVDSLRTAGAHADSVRAAQLGQVIATLGLVRDSLGTVSGHVVKLQGDVRGDLHDVNEQLLQIQQLTGQSQNRLQDLRASIEQRNQDVGAGAAPASTPAARGATMPAGATPAPGAPGSNEPGPNQLYQLGMEQLQRGSPSTAVQAFQKLLQDYGTADIAPEAQFYLGEAYRAQGNAAAADTAYSLVIQKFPKSPHAPTALYKRALYLEQQGNATAARALLNQLITSYPQSDEAALARDHLRDLK
jgi:tol-pal system protein YbgF